LPRKTGGADFSAHTVVVLKADFVIEIAGSFVFGIFVVFVPVGFVVFVPVGIKIQAFLVVLFGFSLAFGRHIGLGFEPDRAAAAIFAGTVVAVF